MPGLGTILPLLFGGGASLGSLIKQWQASQLGRESTQPGYYPGTRTSDQAYTPPQGVRVLEDYPQFADLLGTISQYSAQPYAQQYAENQRAYERQVPYADRAVGLYEGTDPSQAGRPGMTFQGRIAGYDQAAQDISSRISANTEYVQQQYKEKAEAGTGGLEAKIQDIVQAAIGSNQQAYGQLASNQQSAAAARGVSPAALQSINANLAAQNRFADQQAAGDIAQWGIEKGEGINQEYLKGLERISGMIGAEAAPIALLGGLADNLLTQQTGGLTNALYTRGALEQPEDLLTPGAQMDARNLYNTALQMGADEAMAAMLANLGSMGLGLGFDRINANKMAEAAGGTSFADIFTPLAQTATAALLS